MPIAVANPPREAIDFPEFIAAIAGLPVDGNGAPAPIGAAPALGALACNRDFLGEAMIAELKRHCAGQVADNDYGAQVIMLHRADGRHSVRANIWPAAHDAEYRADGAGAYFYGCPHDHNFDFLTVGYYGPGYVSDYYDYGEGADSGVLCGYAGEPVPLRFVERSTLSEGRMLLYRAGIDIHCQWPPERLSISLNVMDSSHAVRWRNQYLIDVAGRSVARQIGVSASECLLAVAVHYNGNGRDIATEFARAHPCARMRWSAAEAIASSLTTRAERHAHFAALSANDDRFVAANAAAAARRIETAAKTDATALS